jgi:hypothetical protein
MYAIKASVAQVNWQILRQDFLCFVLQHPLTLPVRFLLKDADINCTSNCVCICSAGCQPLLRALRFAQHNNNMFQLADCIHSLALILWPKLI